VHRNLTRPHLGNSRWQNGGHPAFLLLALFAEMERTSTAERAAHARAVAQAAAGRSAARSRTPSTRSSTPRLLKVQGHSVGTISAKTGIPKTSLHRYVGAEGPT
jgi:hypothetical protein